MSIDWTAADDVVAAALLARGVESDLADADLAAYARGAVEQIAARGLGPQTGIQSHHDGSGLRLITLDPPAATVDSVTEFGIDLDEDADYRLRPGGAFLERINANGYPLTWRGLVLVEYDAAPADDRYDGVVVDLVKLALQYSALASRNDGDYAESGPADYQAQRAQLIAELVPDAIGFA